MNVAYHLPAADDTDGMEKAIDRLEPAKLLLSDWHDAGHFSLFSFVESLGTNAKCCCATDQILGVANGKSMVSCLLCAVFPK